MIFVHMVSRSSARLHGFIRRGSKDVNQFETSYWKALINVR